MIRLHHAHQTRSMRVLWLLYELGIEFETIVHAFGKNLREPDYLALNPAGRVPALEVDEQVLFESGAILEYLCEQLSPSLLGREQDHAERAEWLVWVHFAETMTQHVAALTQQHIALYEEHMRSPIVMKLEAARLGKCYAALNGRLARRDYILDGGFSAADVACGYSVYAGSHYAKLDGFEALEDWYARMRERPAFQRSLPPESERIYKRDFYPVPE